MDCTGAPSDFDICHVNKRQQKALPKEALNEANGPMELADGTPTSWGLSSALTRGAMCTSETDDSTRINDIFLLKSKDQAVDSRRFYN